MDLRYLYIFQYCWFYGIADVSGQYFRVSDRANLLSFRKNEDFLIKSIKSDKKKCVFYCYRELSCKSGIFDKIYFNCSLYFIELDSYDDPNSSIYFFKKANLGS